MTESLLPKRTLSPEHKAKLMAGREKHMAERQQSRGRPATRHETAPMPAERPQNAMTSQSLEDIIDNLGSGEHLTRESRINGDNTFDVPMQGRRSGWDYQWWPTHVVGQEVDPSFTVNIKLGSWFEVPASHFPQLCPPGWSRPTIDREGQRLYMRPERLSRQARDEANKLAFEQKQNRLAAALAGDAGREMAPRKNADGSSAVQISTGVQPLI